MCDLSSEHKLRDANARERCLGVDPPAGSMWVPTALVI